jgi:hypothetical protein
MLNNAVTRRNASFRVIHTYRRKPGNFVFHSGKSTGSHSTVESGLADGPGAVRYLWPVGDGKVVVEDELLALEAQFRHRYVLFCVRIIPIRTPSDQIKI